MAHRFERLLLATEHTEFDSGAERVALALCRRCDLPLSVVMPVFSNPEYEMVAPELAAQAEARAASRLGELEAAARREGVTLHARVRRGAEPYREIVDEALAQATDLIVARRRGRRGFLANLLLGEMVSQVVSHAPCSVLLVPRAAAPWSKRVLLALDPDAPATLRNELTETAVALAAECGVPLTVACAVEAGATERHVAAGQVLAQAREAARARGVEADGAVHHGKPFQQVIAAADACGADLIVVGRHGGAVAGRAWLGGTAQKVIGLADRPVLVVVPRGQTA